jgi:hypothetical protein
VQGQPLESGKVPASTNAESVGHQRYVAQAARAATGASERSVRISPLGTSVRRWVRAALGNVRPELTQRGTERHVRRSRVIELAGPRRRGDAYREPGPRPVSPESRALGSSGGTSPRPQHRRLPRPTGSRCWFRVTTAHLLFRASLPNPRRRWAPPIWTCVRLWDLVDEDWWLGCAVSTNR